jgi:LysR family hydrogen peroxide-inducible transcriptional activator
MPESYYLDAGRLSRQGAPNTLELHQIRYFLAVCEELNFTRAAEKCNVSQPALSRAVQKLEEELGGLLFRRERASTHLTDLGQLMRPRLEQILAETAEVKSTAKRFLNLQNAPLKVGVMCTIGPLRFIGFLARFRQDHPGIELTLVEGVPAELAARLSEGGLDLAVMVLPPGADERLQAQTLYEERFVVAFPPGHRFESRNAVRMADMQGESYLTRINCEYYDQLSEACRARNVVMADAYRSEREDWIQTMVMAGMGVCFMPEFSPVLPGLQQRLLIEPELVRRVCLVTVAGRRFSPATAAFVRAIRAYKWPSESGPAKAAATKAPSAA